MDPEYLLEDLVYGDTTPLDVLRDVSIFLDSLDDL